MFERRVKILLFLLALPTLAVVLRLGQMQILRAADYQADAARMMKRPPRYFPPLRGDITDCRGRKLAFDTPSWDICVAYPAIVHDLDSIRLLLRRRKLFRPEVDTPQALARRIEESWQAIAEFTGTPLTALMERAEEIRLKVQRIKAAVEQRSGIEIVVAEERMAHPVVRDLPQPQQVAASLHFRDYPWIEVEASHTRQYVEGPAWGHLLGRLGPVDASTLLNDPQADDDLAAYRFNDLRGISGIEALGERILRGRRGRVQLDLEGRPVGEAVEPVDGRPFRLTIDSYLQEVLFEQLAAAVEASAFRTGGCAVLLHVPTRQVLAMVDYPSLDLSRPPAPSLNVEQERARQPELFRAVRGLYPPGSTIKSALLAGALSDALIHEQTTFTCHGRLFQDYPDRWRCTGMHGSIAAVSALQHSCNVYFFHLGQLMGVLRAGHWLTQFGLGKPTGCGLIEEAAGNLPANTSVGQARLIGVGQGELLITPLQAANMAACIAEGRFRPVSLWLDDPAPPPAVALPVSSAAWSAVRRGMYEVVNAPGGTAYGSERGTLDDPEYVMLGKTGSAEVPGVTVAWSYVCHFPDGRVQEIEAGSREELLARFPPDRQPRITGWRSSRRYPPGQPPTHAWFIGYLAPRARPLATVEGEGPAFAIAVVLEYTGHGGEYAAPLARQMMQVALTRYRELINAPSTEDTP